MRNSDSRARSRTAFITLFHEQETAPVTAPAHRRRRGWAALAILGGLSLSGGAAYRLWPRTLGPHPAPSTPTWALIDGRDIVALPGRFLVARVAEYDDELYTHLMSQYLRGAAAFRNTEVLMTYRNIADRVAYSIEVLLDNDLLSSVPRMAAARMGGLIKDYDLRFVDEGTLSTARYQTQVFCTAYNLTRPRDIGQINSAELVAYVARFVQFKSAVDPRIRKNIEPVPRPLTRSEARRLAADIVTVADFYSLPVAPFLGIGAMENNYMNVKGDLKHAIWKKRAHRGDVVLKRGPRGVLVLNPSSGVWQITRETLRGVHRLYLSDRRDYCALPEHLRPPRELDVDNTSPDVLTTYAGLLFRNLFDRFEGDLAKAIGAYNGGPANPNPRYEQGVQRAAEHASVTVLQAAALHGRPAAGMQFLRPAR
jgi:hypothetical protein